MSFIFKRGLAKTIETYEKWWDGRLNRGIFPVAVTGLEPNRPAPKYPYNDQILFGDDQALFADKKITPGEVIDCIDYGLSTMEYLGDYYPHCNMTFSGPGVIAAFLGASVKISDKRVWFFPEKETDIRDLHFRYDAGNYWLNRIKEIVAEGVKRWGDEVVIGLPDLGGVLDIIAVFRSAEGLLFDLYDHPEDVSRLVKEVCDLWHVYFNEISALYAKDNAYSDWSGLLSKKPAYMLQSDFSYMIGNGMFNEFVLPELTESCARLARGCYHLDGIGQLAHLNSLLQIKNLRLIQWVPGSGEPEGKNWDAVYGKIWDSGRLAQKWHEMIGDCMPSLDKTIAERGSSKGIANGLMLFDRKDRDKALKLLDKYEVE